MSLRNVLAVVATGALCLAFGYGVGSRVAVGPAAPAQSRAPQSSVALAASQAPPAPSSQNPPLTENLIPQIVAKAQPAVVAVFTHIPGSTLSNGFFYTQTPPSSGIGSGFIINPSGLILTNDHVVAGASSIQVKVNGYAHLFNAQVVGTDYGLDLALLRIHAPKPLPTLPLGNSAKVPIGAWDIAIGNPEGLQNTVTVGVVS